ncbi:MAG: DUF937 domain-containing protein [Lautropia sp.]|nr:DUF937 domain-containing protein [Lautropia sp.]
MSEQNDLSQQLLSQLQGQPMQQLAQQLGTNTEQANSAVSQALPMLMNALGNQSQGGLSSLLGSLGGGSGAGGLGGLAGMLGGLLGSRGAGQSGGSAGGLGDLLGGVLGGDNAQATSAPQPTRQPDQNPQEGQPGQQAPSVRPAGTGDVLGDIFGQQRDKATEQIAQSSGLGSDRARTLLVTLAPIVIAFLGQRYLSGRNNDDAGSAGGSQSLNDMARNSGASLGSLFDQNGDGKLDMNDVVKLGSTLFGGKR